MEVSEVLTKAAEAVEAADLPEEFRLKAFDKAIELVAGSIDSSYPDGGQAQSADMAPGESDPLTRLAQRVSVPVDLVRDVYFQDGDALGLGLASSQLERAKAAATKDLALLICVGRQAAGYDEDWTSLDEIRRVAIDYGKYDEGNFASTISEMGAFFQIRGPRRQRQVKVKRPGFEHAARLIERLGNREA